MSDTKKHVERAYGLLWHVTIDTGTPQGRLVSDARKALLEVLTHEERGSGIALAKEWIGDHPRSGYSAPFYQSAMTDRTPMQRALERDTEIEDLARINALVVDALCDALPYVEDALTDEGFKPGTVQKVVAKIRHAMQVAGATDALGKEPK